MQPVAHLIAYYTHLARAPSGRPRKADHLAAEVKRLSLAGKSLRQIARKLGTNHEQVRQLLKLNEVDEQ